MYINVNNQVRIPLIKSGDSFKDTTKMMHYTGHSMVQYPNDCLMALREVYDYELLVPGDDYVIETSENNVTCQIQNIKPNYITAYSTNFETYADGRLIYPPIDIPVCKIKHIYSIKGYITD